MSKGNLKPRDQDCIRTNYRYLKNELEPRFIIDFLFEKNVINLDEREKIKNQEPKSERSETLLTALLHSGPGEAFNYFLESLEESYPHVLDKLERTGETIDEMKAKDETLKVKHEALKVKDEALKVKDEALKVKDEALKVKDDEIKAKDYEVLQLKNKLEELKKENLQQKNLITRSKVPSGDIDLILIGLTGGGKSALENSILRREAFRSLARLPSVTSRVQFEVSEFNDRVINVADGPGFFDTRISKEKSTNRVMEAIVAFWGEH